MDQLNKINQQIHNFQELDNSVHPVDKKLDELIALLESSEIDSDAVKKLQQKFNKAVERTDITKQELKFYEELDTKSASRIDLINDLETLLYEHPLDSRITHKVLIRERMAQIVRIIISLIMITLGFAMIIMPAPPYFEMFTIFYFNINDGVTLMDLISLLIVFTGIYLLITSITRHSTIV